MNSSPSPQNDATQNRSLAQDPGQSDSAQEAAAEKEGLVQGKSMDRGSNADGADNLVGSSDSTVISNRRPDFVIDLLHGDKPSEGWFFANRLQARFFLINLEILMGKISKLEITATKDYFRAAEKEIANATDWPRQYAFQYESSHTHIYPAKVLAPKMFGHAATIIVAMEKAAAALQPGLNVYDYLRILPAHFFIDEFDSARLDALETHYTSLSKSDRQEWLSGFLDIDTHKLVFKNSDSERGLSDLCLMAMTQKTSHVPAANPKGGFLRQLANGYCVTFYAATRLEKFINSGFPDHLHIGPVRVSGDDQAISQGLGRKGVVHDLVVRRSFSSTELNQVGVR